LVQQVILEVGIEVLACWNYDDAFVGKRRL